ncbi:hypothetical protein HYN69_18005 (plasmid) [Gemmobacter aquarius]|uniref:Uncharacterized protein n=1 Tax=Paragemmobacter aquarius TaxID=2169400 RepID=A0A2S0URQ7_9RHOB|nr:hypothetical protein [Gemmobacter aquarius]AWB50509.1 hypothetical protein HYN69_18005 [Gemmobacter aquarius]
MLTYSEDDFLTLHEAASRLGVGVDLMLAWNMVVILECDGRERVPGWSVDPRIVKYLPTISQFFQGEALSYVLTTMRPLHDARDGRAALRDGHWPEVLAMVQDLRERFDAVMLRSGPLEANAFLTDPSISHVTLH